MGSVWLAGVGAFVGAFLLAASAGGPAIEGLRRLGAKQNINTDAPATHSAKQGTPTMGGLLILGAMAIIVPLLWLATHANILVHLLLLTLAFGGIGFLDDYLSAKRGKNLGLRAREKFGLQIGAAGLFAFWMYQHQVPGTTSTVELAPTAFGASLIINFGIFYYLMAILLIVGLSNATNFTDGLDGLCSGVTLAVCFALALIFSGTGNASLTGFVLALAGGVAGFLWWNAHPARMFMGDTGSLPLGAALAGVALVGKQEMPLIVATVVFWAVLFSVMIQVTVFKWRRKTRGLEYAKANRVFRRAPLHHHFEELGWPETRVVTRFWLAAGVCALLALLWNKA